MTTTVDTRLRVLQVIARMNVGGPASQVLALVDGLDRSRFAVALATGEPGRHEAESPEASVGSRPVRRLPHLGPHLHLRDDVEALARLDRLVRRCRPNLVHTHTAKAGVLGRLVARRHGLPSVHTFHGHLLHGYFGSMGTRGVIEAERRLAHHTDRLVTVGQRTRDELLAAGIGRSEQYTVVYPGVAAMREIDRSEARADLGLPERAAVLAYVGRLTGIKRPDRLLEVVARLADAGQPVTLLVAGDGELRVEVEASARQARLDVRFLGWCDDIARIYAAADLALLASDNEGMPVSLVEAALCGRAAVASDVGSVAEVVTHGETGLVTFPDAGSLAAAVRRLLADEPLRVRLGDAARRRAMERFTPENVVDTHGRLYEQLMAERLVPWPRRAEASQRRNGW